MKVQTCMQYGSQRMDYGSTKISTELLRMKNK